jgi:aspartate 1-decarboxylase
MLRTMLKSKLDRVMVTQADPNAAGSITVDSDLLDAADLLPGERVAVVDLANGNRLETYLIAGERGTGVVYISGAAARLVRAGDIVTVVSYATIDDDEARTLRPRVVHVDNSNHVVEIGDDPSVHITIEGADPVPPIRVPAPARAHLASQTRTILTSGPRPE